MFFLLNSFGIEQNKIRHLSPLPDLLIRPGEWDWTNRPLKWALVRKFTTKRPCLLMRMLVGNKEPKRRTPAIVFFCYMNDSNLSEVTHYPVVLLVGDCQYRLSREWQYHKQRWDAAQIADQSAAIRRYPLVSGTRMTHKGAHAGSRTTEPGSEPARSEDMKKCKKMQEVTRRCPGSRIWLG